MANIVVNLARLNDAITGSTLSLVANSLDKLVEKHSPSLLPIELGNTIIPHSNSPRYPNGDLKPIYLDGSVLSDTDKENLLNTYTQKKDVQKDIRTILNFIKVTIHNAVLMANAVNTYNPTQEIYYLVRENLPKELLEDRDLLFPCFNTEDEYNLFMTANRGNLSDENLKEFFDKTTYPEVNEIFTNYYALNLLTNVA